MSRPRRRTAGSPCGPERGCGVGSTGRSWTNSARGASWTGPRRSSTHLTWLRERGLIPRIARPGIESSERLGRHRWKIERSIAWLFGYRRLTIRYERKCSHFLAFLGLAAALTCYKKLAKLAT